MSSRQRTAKKRRCSSDKSTRQAATSLTYRKGQTNKPTVVTPKRKTVLDANRTVEQTDKNTQNRRKTASETNARLIGDYVVSVRLHRNSDVRPSCANNEASSIRTKETDWVNERLRGYLELMELITIVKTLRASTDLFTDSIRNFTG